MVFLQILLYLAFACIAAVAPFVIGGLTLGEVATDRKEATEAVRNNGVRLDAADASAEEVPASDKVPVWIAPTRAYDYERPAPLAPGAAAMASDPVSDVARPKERAQEPPSSRTRMPLAAGGRAMNVIQPGAGREVYNTPPLADD